MSTHTFNLIWGVLALVGGGVLVTNIRGAADRLQAMSYAYRAWPTSVNACRAFGGFFVIVGAVVLGGVALGF
ncbi:hypothetical protein [Streptomyces sp. NPDC002402]